MLAAFRWMVEEDPATGKYRWRGGFNTVLRRWHDATPELMRLTFEQNRESGRTPNALGKSRTHWSNLHTRLAKIDQEAELEALRKRLASGDA